MELDTIQTLCSREDTLTLWKKCKIAYHDKVLDATAKRRKDSGATYRLKTHPYKTESDILTRCIGLGIAKERSNGIHRQTFKRIGADILYQQVDMGEVTLFGKSSHLLDIISLEKQSGKSLKRTATNTNTTNVLDIVAIALDNRCTSAKTYNKHAIEFCLITCSQAIGNKLLCLVSRQSVYRFVDIGAAYTGKHNLLYIRKLYMIIVKILAKSTIKRRYGVGGTYAYG